MKISDYIKNSIDETERGNLESALMHVCAAIDGTAKKLYADTQSERRIKRFISDHIAIVQHMFGGIDLENTVFPLKNKKGVLGIKFEEILYSHYRCKLMHGDDLGDGWGVEMSIAMHHDQFSSDLVNKTMTLPQSAIYALGLSCVLSTANVDQKLDLPDYFYKDMHHISSILTIGGAKLILHGL